MFSQKSSSDCHLFQELRTPSQTVYTHDQNIQYPHHLGCNHYPSHHYFVKHQPNSMYIPPISYQKTWSSNQVPLFVNNCSTVQSSFPCRSLLVKTMDNKYLRLPITSCNVPDIHYFNHYQNQESSKKEKNLFNKYDLSSNISQKIIEVPGVLNDVEYKNFLKKEELNLKEHIDYSLEKKKIESDEKRNFPTFLPFADNILETLTVNKSLKVCIENLLNRLKQDVSVQKPTDKTPSMSIHIETEKLPYSHYQRSINSPFTQKKNNLQNELKTTNSSSIHQTNSINELTAYKQQYYDALLHIQRAKMAVANSLALSSGQSYGDFDSFYTNYGQQFHWTTQQLEAKTMNKSTNCQKLFHSQYSNANDPCIRAADWNSYPSSKIQQEFPYIHALPMYRSRYVYNYPNDTPQYCDLSSKSKTNAKRRKLYNTTVELTKGDTNSMHY
ncbi:uncharacterized protein [Chelonus insularis]|uniref:uncharacterized protein n=1 Tax=Chelonus insularis TaxID=460826 RepID=UPI00158E4DC2|nr:uncharacterized protein LOC118067229 [Chelonus insularis]XP_034939763.1 uncharacterized protein LOC118067229 [Chelonus insularis]